MNFSPFLANLQHRGIDPNSCLDELDALMGRLPTVQVAGAKLGPTDEGSSTPAALGDHSAVEKVGTQQH